MMEREEESAEEGIKDNQGHPSTDSVDLTLVQSSICTNAGGVNLEDLQTAAAAEALLSLKILSAANDQFKGVDLTSDYADDKTELEALLDGGFDDIAQASGGDAAGTSSASGPSQQSVNGGSNNNSPNERKIKKATRKNPAIPVLKSGKGIDMPLSDDPVQLELTREQREKMEFADNCEKKMMDIFNQLKIHAQEEGISVSDLSEDENNQQEQSKEKQIKKHLKTRRQRIGANGTAAKDLPAPLKDLDTCSFKDCTKKASMACPICSWKLYCSKKHMKQNAQDHVEYCLLYRASFSKELGSHWIVHREMKPGRDIQQEAPKMFTPVNFDENKQEENWVCSFCCMHIQNLDDCDRCEWPRCPERDCIFSVSAEVKYFHQENECSYLRNSSLDAGSQLSYDCLLLQRIISLKNSARANYAIIYNWILENCSETDGTNNDSKKNQQQYIIGLVRNQMKFDAAHISDDDIIQLMQIIFRRFLNFVRDDDSVKPEEHKRYGRGIYDFASRVMHSCVPNFAFVFRNENLTTTVLTPVQKGDIITANYDWKIMTLPTSARRNELKKRYDIDCRCVRCLDPTELGTFFSGISCTQTETCKQLNDAFILPKNPLDPESSWACNKCEKKEIRKFQINLLLEKIDDQLEQNNAASLQDQNDFLVAMVGKYEGLHWNHFLVFNSSLQIMINLYHESNNRLHNKRESIDSIIEDLRKYRQIAGSINNIVTAFFPNINHGEIIAECRMAALIQLDEFFERYAEQKMTFKQLGIEVKKLFFRDMRIEGQLMNFKIQKAVRNLDDSLDNVLYKLESKVLMTWSTLGSKIQEVTESSSDYYLGQLLAYHVYPFALY